MSLFKDRLVAGLNILDIHITEEAVEALELYFTELKKWSRRVNLIAKSTSDEQIVENHFLDSLTLLPLLGEEKKHLVDIGSGAGFPGLVCKVACPEMDLTLVEPRLKRVSFLKHLVRLLELKNVQIQAERIEDSAGLRGKYNCTHITARAVADIGGLLRMVEGFEQDGVQVLLMKGPRWKEELADAEAVLGQSAFALVERKICFLPFSGAERSLLIFRKK